MYFTVSGIELNPLIPLFTAFIISFFTSMGGVSGAFLLLPFQVSVLGFNTPAVSATNQLYNIVAIPSGVYRYFREGRMVWPLNWGIVIGTLPGVFIGAVIRIQFLPDPKNFKLFAASVLLYIGYRLFKDIIEKIKMEKAGISDEERFPKPAQSVSPDNDSEILPQVVTKKFNFSRIAYEFNGRGYEVSTAGIMALSFIVGIVGGVYGIGGGAIIAPFLISFFSLPVYTVAGAALMGTFVTSVAGVLFYHIAAPFYPGISVSPDWGLGFLFGIGGFAGIYFGARMQKYFPAKIIKSILFVSILTTSVKYILDFFN